jgi:cytochrome c peroxidase
MKNSVLPLLLLLGIFQACDTETDTPLKEAVLALPSTPYEYGVSFNNDVPTLGRVLFYDKSLSLNNSVSCSSCHKQSLAFADNVSFSTGFENKKTSRNSMPIQNLQSLNFEQISLFWDGREKNLQTMVLRPIANHVEMGMDDFDALSKKLANIPYYENLFQKAYGTSEVDAQRISDALSMFLLSINSRDTKLDRAMNGNVELSALEIEGQQLFMEKYDCNSCHQVADPEGYILAGTFANIGLDEVYTDNGVGEVTGNPQNNGEFKIPSLRNVALTAPYMHDGRFETLDDVIEHYSTGIENNENLDFRLRSNTGEPMQFNITPQEATALKAFLMTLTDSEMVSAARFSDPFKIN